MSELTVLLLRVGFFVLLWIFVLLVARVLSADLFGPVSRRIPRKVRKTRRGRQADRRVRQVAVPPAQAPPLLPRALVVTAGRQSGMTIELTGDPITIGRAADNVFVIDDDYASSRHARLSFDGQVWHVEDLGSTNGTYIGANRLTQPAPIHPGTSFVIGHTHMELRP